MWNFLDLAEDIALAGQLDTDTQAAFDRVFRGIAHLRVAQSKARLDLNNVEAVFAAFEMAGLLNMDIAELPPTDQLVSDMRRLISTTLDVAVRFPIKRRVEGSPVRPHTQYAQLADCMRNLYNAERDSVAVISFNYDIALERALNWHDVPYYYGVDGRSGHGIPYLKLHGSVNWAQCKQCREVSVIGIEALFHANGRLLRHRIEQGDSYVTLPVTGHVTQMVHCNAAMEPGVVPPIWNKTQYHRELQAVWRRASVELQKAENIVVIGYSIPDTDQFFRYLYALASTSETRLKRFVVVNPDEAAERRFKNMLGQSAEDRFEFIAKTWEEAAGWVVAQDWQRRASPSAA